MIKKIYKSIFPETFRNKLIETKNAIIAQFLKGKDFTCNFCEEDFSKFLAKGNGLEKRENAQCPKCGSLERTRLLYFYLQNETKIFEGQKAIFHVSPESCLRRKFIGNPNYIDADINKNLANYEIDITKIPYENESFDYVICSHVLGHILDQKQAINELFRILKPGASAYILTLLNLEDKTFQSDKNLSSKEKLELYGEHDLLRLHGTDFEDYLKRDSMNIEKIDYRQHFDADFRKQYSLGDGKREQIFKCTKK
jgi:SAM-dependent methyltransferase